MTPAALLFAAALALPGSARAASDPAAYDAKAAPLDDLSRELLAGNGYEIRADGKVWDKIGEAPVSRADIAYLLSRLASAKRLRALLEINNIITRYDAERKLTPEDKEAVRVLVRRNWVVFGRSARNDFRSYFSVEELESLDKIAPRFETMSAAALSAFPAESVTAAAPAAPAAAPSFKAEPAAPPPEAARVAPPPAPSTSAVVSEELGTLKPWTPPAGSTIAAAPPPAPPATAAATTPQAAAVGEAEYEQFVASGPYTKESKAALELIAKRAPDYCLPLLRRTVVGAMPQIVGDGARTGAELRAGFSPDATNPPAPPVVALSPGPVFVEIKKSLFGPRAAVLLPESPRTWADLGVARPPLDALRENATPVSTENGEWGATRVYADGSRRGSYAAAEQAGELLEQLLLLGLSREGLDASAYAARRWARTARLMFAARLKEETRRDDFLDPDRRAELRGWLGHPDEADDLTAAAWAGSRANRLDPRRGPPDAARDFESRAGAACALSALEDSLVEASRRRAGAVGALESLADAGVLDGAVAKAAARSAVEAERAATKRLLESPRGCAPADAALDEKLRKAASLMAESARAERLMRERKPGIESHAL